MATTSKKPRKRKAPPQPQQEAAEPVQPAQGDGEQKGWEIVRLTDIIPEGRPMEIDGQPYTLLHPGAMSMHDTAVVDRLRKKFWQLFRKWDADKASEKESDELDKVGAGLVPLVTDVPEAVVKSWRWQTRFKVIMLHFGFIAETLPNLLLPGMPRPNRAARRRGKTGRTGESSSPRSATAIT